MIKPQKHPFKLKEQTMTNVKSALKQRQNHNQIKRQLKKYNPGKENFKMKSLKSLFLKIQ